MRLFRKPLVLPLGIFLVFLFDKSEYGYIEKAKTVDILPFALSLTHEGLKIY
jgi:hypothetical protein